MKFIDLYSGAGFGARGAVSAGATPIMAVDSWSLAAQNYKANFPDTHVINESVESVDPYEYAKNLTADVLLTSPECTSHSIARGAKLGCENSRETAINILPWVDAFSPDWVIVENVVRMRKWDRHNELKDELTRLGYKISEVVLNSADFGVPQKRKRLFLICGNKSEPPKLEDFEKRFCKKLIPAQKILDANDKWSMSPLYKKGRAESTLARAERAINALGKKVPFLIVYYGSDYAGGWQSIEKPLRTVTTLDRFALVIWKDGEYLMRMLQPPELVKAMGAGSKHKLPVGNRRDKVKLCGNGVCSPVMEEIFKAIKKKSC